MKTFVGYKKLFVAILFLSAAFSNFGCAAAPLKIQPQHIMQNFKYYERKTVYGGALPWTKTHITAQKGDIIIFLASGEVSISPKRPAFKAWRRLVYRIGDDMLPEPIYSSYMKTFDYAVVAEHSGRLELAVWDWKNHKKIDYNRYKNNTGAFLVDIFVIDKSKEEFAPDLLNDLAQANPQDPIFNYNVERFVRQSTFYLASKKTEKEISETRKEINRLKGSVKYDEQTGAKGPEADKAQEPAEKPGPSISQKTGKDRTDKTVLAEPAEIDLGKNSEIARLESKLATLEETLAKLEDMKIQYEDQRQKAELLAKELAKRDQREKTLLMKQEKEQKQREAQLLEKLKKAGQRPPFIFISSPRSAMDVEVEKIYFSGVIEDDGEIASVELGANGNIVKDISERGILVSKVGGQNQFEFKERMILKKGKNILQIKVTDSDGLVSAKEVVVNRIDSRKNLWAAVIGIDQYKNVNHLRYAAEDAHAFYNHLIQNIKIPQENITLLINQDAHLDRMRSTLGTHLKRKAGKDDMVLIYFAGHGATEDDSLSPDGDGLEKYILPYDADLKDLYASALPMTEISKIFSRIKAERLIFIVDACYSGASGGRTIGVPGKRANISEAFIDRISSGKGRVVMTASGANEISMEKEEFGHGVFTYYLLEGLKGDADFDKDDIITVDELYHYASVHVPLATGQSQHPVKKGSVEGQLILGVVQ